MNDVSKLVIRFLTSLAQAISAMTLYKRAHPAVVRAVDVAYGHLFELQTVEPRAVITFLGDEVVFKSRPVPGLKTWEWGPRLAEVGVQRLEFDGPATRADFERFLSSLHARLSTEEEDPLDERGAIRYGAVELRGQEDLAPTLTGLLDYSLKDEIEAMAWVNAESRERGTLHLAEADTVVRSLALAMHSDQEFMIPLVYLKGHDQYTATHSLNISVLSMALAEFIEVPARDVTRIGVAGLLHDIGKTRIPTELLNKPGKLEPEEKAQIDRHPVEGAKILIEREAGLDLAAIVAYEHHIRYDGGGYPTRTYKRPCHPASDLVHVCDVYDALRTHRPYREAWEQERVLGYLEEGLGAEFEPRLGEAFIQLMRRWEDRLFRVTHEDNALPNAADDETKVDSPARVPVAG